MHVQICFKTCLHFSAHFWVIALEIFYSDIKILELLNANMSDFMMFFCSTFEFLKGGRSACSIKLHGFSFDVKYSNF